MTHTISIIKILFDQRYFIAKFKNEEIKQTTEQLDLHKGIVLKIFIKYWIDKDDFYE
jgi:hypothetical protein